MELKKILKIAGVTFGVIVVVVAIVVGYIMLS
jgi:hypothetical protein